MSALIDLPNKETPGIPDTSKAIGLLYEKAVDNLSDAELDWFAESMRKAVTIELNNVGRTLENAALIVSNTDLQLAGQDEESLSIFLFSLANQIDTISGFLKISDDAAYRLNGKA